MAGRKRKLSPSPSTNPELSHEEVSSFLESFSSELGDIDFGETSGYQSGQSAHAGTSQPLGPTHSTPVSVSHNIVGGISTSPPSMAYQNLMQMSPIFGAAQTSGSGGEFGVPSLTPAVLLQTEIDNLMANLAQGPSSPSTAQGGQNVLAPVAIPVQAFPLQVSQMPDSLKHQYQQHLNEFLNIGLEEIDLLNVYDMPTNNKFYFQLSPCLGSGTYASVYVAWNADPNDNEEYAIKRTKCPLNNNRIKRALERECMCCALIV